MLIWFGFVVRNGSKKDCFICRVSEAGEKAIDKLDVEEFRERFCIPNGVSIDLVNEEAAMPTEKGEENVILFTKEQFNAGLRFPLPALFKEFLHFSQIPPIFIHPNLVRCVRAPALPSNGDRAARFDKGRGEGAGGGPGCMGGAIERASRPFSPNYTLKIPGLELRGHLVDWVEKASFACVCKLFEIDPKERAYKTLLSARNLIASGSPGISKEADAERRRKLLEDRDQKKTEGTIRKAPGQKRGPDSPPKKTSGKRKLVKKHGKDVKEPTPPKEFPPHKLPMRGNGAESQSQPSDDPDRLAIVLVKGPPPKKPRSTRDLRSGLLGRLQERQQEIEVSCASAHDAHPDGGEVEMATETSAAPEEPADDAAPASPFSYAELEVKLKHYTRLESHQAPAKMFDMIETLVRGLRGMAQQHDLFTQLLQTADYMRTFSSRRQEIENQLRLRMEEAEANLSTMREENEALRVELAEAKSREESTAGRLHEAEGEAARLRDEVSQLRTEVSNEKKQKEDLQLRLDVQKEELEREFAVEREELAADYQQQVMIRLSLGIAAA
ncbi:hypothetical protein CK203_049195 [Vitis vinifera]|uniref:Uncharacterized protein n=1 Tax=Vitis vinifera TaxID=29760 RepID=A0A438GKP1_VITVI|nr:hypothetical protein CK203_049195 [Vitis vinifera]